MLYTADKETGTFIEKVETIDQGLKLIQEYEEEDKTDGTYTLDFYDVVNDNHISMLQENQKHEKNEKSYFVYYQFCSFCVNVNIYSIVGQ